MTREEQNRYILDHTIVDTTYPTSKLFKDISGQKFNKLTAIRYVGKSKTGQIYYEFKCDCGNTTISQHSNVMSGTTVSCGCVSRQGAAERNLRHGHSRTRLYKVYYHMRYRCYNPKKDNYKDYGGRGIYVCDEWMDPENGFINFYNWSMANGYEKGLSIDRIDNDGPYAPWNCRWVTMKVQANNRRDNHCLTYLACTYTIAEWAEICNLTEDAILGRIKNGWTVEEILFTPLNNVDAWQIVVIPDKFIELNKYKETDKVSLYFLYMCYHFRRSFSSM